MIATLVSIFIFPGFLFVSLAGLCCEYIDRKLYARLQNRAGPPWFQPLADFIKLLAKEHVIPCQANAFLFQLAPIFALTAVVCSIFYIPLWNAHALMSFQGDLIVVLYLLTLPTLSFFIGGWYSTSLFARLGTVRSLTQLFSYEVPLFMGLLAPAILADTWSIAGMINFYTQHPWYCLLNIIGFVVAIISLVGKLEKTPFDIPEAETEIVAGVFTEYSGRLLAFFRLTLDIEEVVGISLLAAVFLPFGLGLPWYWAFVVYLIKLVGIVALLALFRTVFARLRMDQMVRFCWKYLAPLAMIQIVVSLVVKGFLPR